MSGVLGEAEINEMLADLLDADGAVAVTVGSVTVTGIFDRAAVQVLDGEMPTIVPDGEAVHVKSDALPGLAPGSAITVDGTSYSVRSLLPYGDGAMTRVALTKTS